MKPLPILLLFLLFVAMHEADAASAAVRHDGFAGSGDSESSQLPFSTSPSSETVTSPKAPFTGLGRPDANWPARSLARGATAASSSSGSPDAAPLASASVSVPAPAPAPAPAPRPTRWRASAAPATPASAALRLAAVVQAYQRAIDRQQSQGSSPAAERSATEATANGDAKEREIEVEADSVASNADADDESGAWQQSQSPSPRRSDLRTKLTPRDDERESGDSDDANADQVWSACVISRIDSDSPLELTLMKC
jgi:hypothetical protein